MSDVFPSEDKPQIPTVATVLLEAKDLPPGFLQAPRMHASVPSLAKSLAQERWPAQVSRSFLY